MPRRPHPPTSSTPEHPPRKLERRMAFEMIHNRLFSRRAKPVRLDRFELIERLGQGGMGVVYRAFDPRSDRTVALKVVRHAIASPRTQARLRREARAAAALSHPNVVTVYESGVLEGDSLFIAMELVAGPTLRKWLADGPHPREAVMAVMLAAGEGLVAAHAAGLVHRDFKPDNVLIGPQGRPRVADFGLAQPLERTTPEDESIPAVYDDASWSDRLTRTGGIVGTPAYMAPERLRGEDATPLSDQFSFCVTLYEAVYGERPFADESLDSLKQALQSGRLRAPPRTSRVPAALRTVIARGLAVDPKARWPSMAALLAALRQTGDRRRRRRALGGWLVGGGVVVGVVVGVAALTHAPAPGDPYDELSSADAGQTLSEEQAAQVRAGREQLERARSLRVAGDHEQSLAVAEQVALAAEAQAYPQLQAEALLEGGKTRAQLGRHAAAQEDLERAYLLAMDQRHDGVALRAAIELIHVICGGLSQCERAEQWRRAVWTLMEQTTVEPEIEVAALLAVSELALAQGGLDEAFALGQQALALAESSLDPADPALANALRSVGNLLDGRSEFEEALRHYERSLAIELEVGGPDHAGVAVSLIGMAWALERVGKYEEALVHCRRALAIQEEVFGPNHLVVVAALDLLGILMLPQGQEDEALRVRRRILAILLDTLGPEHPRVAHAYDRIGAVLINKAQYEDALESFRRSLTVWEALREPGHPSLSNVHRQIGGALYSLGRLEEALEHYQRSLAIAEQTLGPHHLNTGWTLFDMGNTLHGMNQREQARPLYDRALDILESGLGRDHPHLPYLLSAMAYLDDETGHHDLARRRAERALAIIESNSDKFLLPTLCFTMAQVLWSDRSQRRRARAFAKRSRALFAERGGPFLENAQRIDAWLREHRIASN